MFPAFLKIWLINGVLAFFVVFFGVMSFDVWSKGDETGPEVQTVKSPEKPPPGKRIMERTVPPDSTYGIVADKNLFSASRSEILPEKQKKEGPLKISEKQIFLYGVVGVGDRKKALISNPESAPVAGKAPAKDKWVAVGDTIGNFSVTDIRKDRIILADGANTHEILLYDKNKPARQTIAVEASAAPTVVAAGPATVSAATRSDTKPVTEPPASHVAGEKSAPAGEYVIVNTPFGPAKRRIQ
jgi:hypothetical protein